MDSRYWPPFQTEPHSDHVWIKKDLSVATVVSEVVDRYDFKAIKFLGFYVEGGAEIQTRLLDVIRQLKKRLKALFILFEKELPVTTIMDEYYASGVDGLCLLWQEGALFVKTLDYGVKLWPRGHVFVFFPPEIHVDKKTLCETMERGALPLQDPLYEENAIIILQNLKTTKIPLKFIKQLGGLGLPLEEGMMDFLLQSPIGRKVFIDLSDLRRKLMVKSVADSFDSAGL